MNLFALTRDDSRRVVRFSLSAEIQKDIEEMFKQQEAAFGQDALDKISFDGKYKPDEGECLIIDDYEGAEQFYYAIANPLSVPTIRPSAEDFENIKAIFSGRIDAGKNLALIESFDKRKILSTKGFAIFNDGDVYKKVDGIGLALDTRLAPILSNKQLMFFSYFAARQIFDLEKYYKESTDDDLREFAKNPKINITDLGNFIGVSDKWIRRKVAFVMQSGILEKIDLEAAKKTALLFDIDLVIESVNGVSTILLPIEKSKLKDVLKFLDEDYFQSILLSNPHISSSKRRIGY